MQVPEVKKKKSMPREENKTPDKTPIRSSLSNQADNQGNKLILKRFVLKKFTNSKKQLN